MAADGSIKIDTRIDTGAFEHTFEDIDKMCNSTKKHLESIAESLNIKTNPIEIINNSQLAKYKLRQTNCFQRQKRRNRLLTFSSWRRNKQKILWQSKTI